ncbi:MULTISPECIES: helix-turn-helix domain-containing protein [Chryseobacterium]|uniref:AraC family transcriptional regulator of adaptative response / methylphosphotriester-DNA alkyltransferase methyltransferase n=1 Tax=Chryseobacterium camelliae TaxID=1265445 RepID=A0ABU0TI47_9FLAO|nr:MULTISPECIES: AraC family transcriptional regulator [Chryseobacterium]MDT3409404.1 AraC family transcriptional regulator of adaptative response / methylphosphotriester-DNA alkyltransferase methyltransferase [Pseudacidovorax intermedius]MDQ1096731.1 AraC family transcriptional regulator of adaptative response / methylphosphotriester-DNA alkyltransferase methyltransferase [Chryseobacterium camelliae]MDQ1100675.1 AraC family transcriptional regulator of adaptative response / methylphosphotrieste
MEKDENTPKKRSTEITERYFEFLDRHISDVINGETSDFMELNQIAAAIAVSHNHLTDTVQKETGNHPCHFYDAKIIDQAKHLLLHTNSSIADIAKMLTYDPSNFSKFFKKFVKQTPGQFRKENKK